MGVNLGNVAGVVRSVQSPKEADGVTEKTYVLWARPIGEVDEHGHSVNGTYNTFYWSYTVGGWVNLDTQLTAHGALPYGQFFIYKAFGNQEAGLQAGDLLQGWFSNTKFIKAIYLGGPIADIDSFNILEETDF